MAETSRTAQLMLLFRALADAGLTNVREFSDPVAVRLLPRPLGRGVLSAKARLAHRPRLLEQARRQASGFDVIALRTKAIDEALERYLSAGGTQVVILGAGLDTRAWRLSALDEATVFEIDRAGTQEAKRRLVQPLALRAKEVRFAAADLVFDLGAARLAREGFRKDRPTFWLLEGLLPYLPPYAVERLFEQMGKASAKGSVVAATFVPPQPGASLAARTTLEVVRRAFKALGEPFASMLDEVQLMRMVDAAGFQATEVSDLDVWAKRFCDRLPRASMLFKEKLVLCGLR